MSSTEASSTPKKKHTPASSGRQTPRGSNNKSPHEATSPSEKQQQRNEQEKETVEQERTARDEEEEELMIRPWKSPAKASILRKTATTASEVSAGGGAGAATAAAAATNVSDRDDQHHRHNQHIAFKAGAPEVFPDHVFAAGAIKKSASSAEQQQQQLQQQQQPQLPAEIDDACERLYAEAIAKRRLQQEASRERQRALEDPEAGFDEECTFHPEISADAARLKFEDWDQFMHHRNERNKQVAHRWEKKKAQLEREQREKELGEEKKMAPMSEKLLAYKAKKGQPHKGPIKDYDKYLGKFIIKKTSPEKGLNAIESGDDSARQLPDAHLQRELTGRLYDDAVARVAARQVIERARHAADRAKLFHPMTNERLIAKLKELNPDSENDSWIDDANVETRLLSQGESYRLRNERRRNQMQLETLKECTFTPRTNPKSRQLLQNWARRAEIGDPTVNHSVMMRVERNLDQDGDYAPLNRIGAVGDRIYTTEAEALAAFRQQQRQQQQHNPSADDDEGDDEVEEMSASLQSNQGSSSMRSSRFNNKTQQNYLNTNNNNSNKQRHIPDPDGYFEKVKMRQAERARQLAEKRRQAELAKEEGCTFRPAMAPLTVALAKIRDDKEFGSAVAASTSQPTSDPERDREILMPPHLRARSGEWGEQKGSPRKYPRGLLNFNNNNINNNNNNNYSNRNPNSSSGGSNVYDSSGYSIVHQQPIHASASRNINNNNNNNNFSNASPSAAATRRLVTTNRSSNSAARRYPTVAHQDPYYRQQQQQQQRQQPAAEVGDSSEHFLEDLEHELQGVISTWQSTEGM